MPARVQGLRFATSKGKQSDIATAASTFLRWRKLNMDLTTPRHTTETDAAEIGKGNEFISQVFPVAKDVGQRIEKYGSAEFVIWCAAFGLGNTHQATGGGLYTITPIDPGTTIELPYFTVVEQIDEGGGQAIDNMFVGCSLEDFMLTFNYGPGRQSLRCASSFMGSGRITTPSAVTLPAVLTEHYMLSQSMAISINGVDYVSSKTILSGSIGWKNNLNGAAGYFPGAGLLDGAAIRGRQEIGAREASLQFTVRLLSGSTEYAKLIAQTTGTAVVTFTFDSTHTVTFTFPQVSFSAIENHEDGGIVALTVTVAPQYSSGSGILTVTGQCAQTGIGQ